MIELISLFICLVALEVIFEIDNITALKRKVKTLPQTGLCRGHSPHILALCVRITLASLLYYALARITASAHYQAATPAAHLAFKMFGGLTIASIGLALLIGAPQSVNNARPIHSGTRHLKAAKGTLLGFLFADALLSLDSVLATVAMTNNFQLAVEAMASAALIIMVFHKHINAWLKANPRVILLAYLLIIMLGANLILDAFGTHIPKLLLLMLAAIAIWANSLDKKPLKKVVGSTGKAFYRPENAVNTPGGGNTATQSDPTVLPTATEMLSTTTIANTKAMSNTSAMSYATKIPKATTTPRATTIANPTALPSTTAIPSATTVANTTTTPPTTASTLATLRSEFYTFGTRHEAAMNNTDASIGFGQSTPLACHSCGAPTIAGVSVCGGCKSYSYLLPATGMEIGALNSLTGKRETAEVV